MYANDIPKLSWGWKAIMLLFFATAVTAFVLSIIAFTEEQSDTKNITTSGTTTTFGGNVETKDHVQSSQMILLSNAGPNAKHGTSSVSTGTGVLYMDDKEVLHFANSSSDNTIAPTSAEGFLLRDGSLAMQGNFDMGGNAITNAASVNASGALTIGNSTATTSTTMGQTGANTTITGSTVTIDGSTINVGTTGATTTRVDGTTVNIGTSAATSTVIGRTASSATTSLTGFTTTIEGKTLNIGTSVATSTTLGGTTASTTINGSAITVTGSVVPSTVGTLTLGTSSNPFGSIFTYALAQTNSGGRIGTAQLAGGQVVINGITGGGSDIVFVSRKTIGGTLGTLEGRITATNQLTISSYVSGTTNTLSADTSIVSFWIIQFFT